MTALTNDKKRRELLHYYKINKETHALTWPVSITQIIEEIKDIDKKEVNA